MKIKSVFLFLVLSLAGCVTVLGQERVIAEKEFRDIASSSLKRLQTVKYRRTMTSEVIRSTGRTMSFSVLESEPADRSRTLMIYMEGGTTRRFETVTIGSTTYTRSNNEKWTVDSGSAPREGFTVAPGRSGAAVDLKSGRTYKLFPSAKLGTQTTDIYQENETITFNSERGSGKTFAVRKMWINKEGVLLRSESSTANKDGPIQNTVLIYEHDPLIVIEAPIESKIEKRN